MQKNELKPFSVFFTNYIHKYVYLLKINPYLDQTLILINTLKDQLDKGYSQSV